MAKRVLNSGETGTGDRIAYDPIVASATNIMGVSPKNETEKNELFKLIEERWPMFEKLATGSKAKKAKKKFYGLWSELGRDIVDRGIVNLPKKKSKLNEKTNNEI